MGDSTAQEREQAQFYRNEAKEILRKFPGPSLRHDFGILEQVLNTGNKYAARLYTWVKTRTGATFDELEAAITRLAWEPTQNIPEFMVTLKIGRHKAEGLLDRAGIRTMPNSQIGKHE
jgi:hypothetical protein